MPAFAGAASLWLRLVLPLDGMPMAALAAAGSWPKAQRLIEVLQAISEPVRLSFSSGEGRHWSHARVRIAGGR